MKYSIEIGKIVEGALKYDLTKVCNYTHLLIEKLENDGDVRSADKFKKLLASYGETNLTAMDVKKKTDLPVDVESRTALVDVIFPSANNSQVILSENNVNQLESFILSYKNADKLNSLGIGLSNSLLLYGPPGCGKTQCAYFIAKELQLPIVIARLDSLISSYLGTTAKNIRMLFEFAQKMPCVLFLDEFDAVAKARDDSNELGELKRVVNSLLQNIDSMSNDSLLIAATNHEGLLDTAIWRRFDYRLKVELPDFQTIKNMINLFTKGASGLNEKELSELALVFKGLSGAGIEEILLKSLRNSVIHGKEVKKEDYYTEFFNFIGLLSQVNESEKDIDIIKAQYLRNIDSKVFSLQVIAECLGCSKSKIAKLLKEN